MQPEGTPVAVPPSRCRVDRKALRARERRERQRPLLVALGLALAVAAVTGIGVLREIREAGTVAPSLHAAARP